MNWPTTGISIARFCCAIIFLSSAASVSGHGGVVLDEDLCVINIGFYQAHFTVFQPGSRQHEQFCEDLPDIGESIFVLEYLHDGLGDLQVDLRIIRNTTGMGRFTRQQDVAAIADLDAITVFRQPAVRDPDVFAVLHVFEQPGEFVGVVNATHPSGKTYTAVFPFEVGFAVSDYADYLIYVLAFAALMIWAAPLAWRYANRQHHTLSVAVIAAGLILAQPGTTEADTSGLQQRGKFFQLEMQPDQQPILINTMQSWQLLLSSMDGTPVSDASISVSGGMPEHDHGLPTQPRIYASGQPGIYHLHGIRFHMRGRWQLQLLIETPAQSESLTVDLEL